MGRESSVLVLDGAGERMGALALRIRGLGFRVVRAKTAEEALPLLENPRLACTAALLPPEWPVADLAGAVAALRDAAGSDGLTFVGVGPRPAPEAVERLRSAGVSLALWEPFGDSALRFQVNRALAGHRGDGQRRETRVPTEWLARVLVGGRRKEATVYSLSAGGAFLATPRPSLRGASVALELPLPLRDVAVGGRVVYTNVPGNLQRANLPLGMGVVFTALAPEAEREIRRAVAESAFLLVV